MKFDLFQWSEGKPNEEIQAEKGWLRVRSSVVGALYVQAEGVETLVGLGSSWDLEVTSAVAWRVETPKAARVFYHAPRNAVRQTEGEVFTNIDRLPSESGNLLEVRRALRELEFMRRQTLRDIRAERDAAAVPVIEPGEEAVASEVAAE